MIFFKYGLSEEKYKEQFNELSKLHHPDKGGSNNEFILLKEEYEECLVIAKHWENIVKFLGKEIQVKEVVKEVVKYEKVYIPPPPPQKVVEKVVEQAKPFITEEGIKTTAEIFMAGRDIFKEITKSIKEIKKQPRARKSVSK